MAGGSRLRETVIRAVLTGGTLVVEQSLDVGGVFDLRPLVVAARMAGENVRAVGDAHLMRVSEHGQNVPDMRVRDRIVVEVEADIGRLADRDRDTLEQRRRIVRQSQQSRRFVGEYWAVRSGSSGQRRSAAGPLHQASAWALRSSRSVKLRAAKKRHVAPHGSFHAAFLVAARDRDGSRFVAIMSGKTQ